MPVDHKIFDRITGPQWLWYYYSYIQDIEDDFERNRNITEYLASFYNPEAVSKIRERRQNAEDSSNVSVATNLNETLKNTFGRGIDDSDVSDATHASTGNLSIDEIEARVKDYKTIEQLNSDPSRNYKHWATLNLE